MSSAAHIALHGEGLSITTVSCGHSLGCGCKDVSNCCFTCPLTVCRFDIRGGVKVIKAISRNQEITRMRSQGKAISEISDHFSLSITTVSRVLRRHNE